MMEISDELKKAISEIMPCFLATSDKNGYPNVSAKGSLRVHDNQHLAFADLMSPQTVKNLKVNPYVSIIGLDPATRKGWRVWGKAVEVTDSGNLFEKFKKEYAEKGKVNHAVKILVEDAKVF